MKSFVLLIISFVLVQVCSSYSPRECYKKGDCGPNECCVLGMERYSIPECRPRGKSGDWCRAGAEPEDRMLYYPNEEIRHVEEVYTLFCPCDGNLACNSNKCTENEGYAKVFGAESNPVFTKSTAFAKSGSQAFAQSGPSRAFSKTGSAKTFARK